MKTAPSFRDKKQGVMAASVIGVTLVILASALIIISSYLRPVVREQILEKESELLDVTTLLHQSHAEADQQIGSLIDEPLDQLSVILETSRFRLKGRGMAVRLFDSNGKFVFAVPTNTLPATLSAEDCRALAVLKPVSHFYASAPLSGLFSDQPLGGRRLPILEVLVPLHSGSNHKVAGIAQYILDGQAVAAQYATFDAYLFQHGAIFFIVSSVLIGATLGWAFHRLHKTYLVLEQRTDDLLKANHELTVSAKVSAIGAVTAHLIHGLKNPLFGLQNFVSAHESGAVPEHDVDWQSARTTTRRMQTMIAEIVRILQEESSVTSYSLTTAELLDIIRHKAREAAAEKGLIFQTEGEAQAVLGNREANLVILILTNLIQNALQATPRGGRVVLRAALAGGSLEFLVSDEGGGVPPSVRDSLFAPCRSAKEGGTGIGLAISKQLASTLGAELELHRTSEKGSVFRLVLPAELLRGENAARALTQDRL